MAYEFTLLSNGKIFDEVEYLWHEQLIFGLKEIGTCVVLVAENRYFGLPFETGENQIQY